MATTIKIGEEVTVGDTAVEYVIGESTAAVGSGAGQKFTVG